MSVVITVIIRMIEDIVILVVRRNRRVIKSIEERMGSMRVRKEPFIVLEERVILAKRIKV